MAPRTEYLPSRSQTYRFTRGTEPLDGSRRSRVTRNQRSARDTSSISRASILGQAVQGRNGRSSFETTEAGPVALQPNTNINSQLTTEDPALLNNPQLATSHGNSMNNPVPSSLSRPALVPAFTTPAIRLFNKPVGHTANFIDEPKRFINRDEENKAIKKKVTNRKLRNLLSNGSMGNERKKNSREKMILCHDMNKITK